MINWDDLQHIHVIRKLEKILNQWFYVDLFFLDEFGQIRNDFSINGKKKEFKNPLTSILISHEKGKNFLFDFILNLNDKIYQNKETHFLIPGPIGIESMFISKVVIDNEFLGSVLAYCFFEKELPVNLIEESKNLLKKIGIVNGLEEFFKLKLDQFKFLNDYQKKYFYELVDLVAEEIVTFHTEITKREERINALNNQLGNRYSYGSMIGKSKPMQDLYSLLDKIKNSESTVLIQGENGTGKELIARAIHYNSPRKEFQFITLNCSAFNENLLDSELFGHVKGSFTGAIRDKKGLFEAAHGGTLFLDEIGDMPLAMQVKLLRVLQEGTLIPVGGTEQRKVDVRVVAATNKDLKEMIENDLFREDLYYRINVINLVVPPLRERKEDIPLLLEHFIARGCEEKKIQKKIFINRTLEKIFDYSWPGNIRELENEIERLIVLSGEEQKISVELLSHRIRENNEKAKNHGLRVSGKLKDSLEELERTMIREGLRRTNWNKSRLAKELGISRAGLIMKVEKYNLDKRKVLRAGIGTDEAA